MSVVLQNGSWWCSEMQPECDLGIGNLSSHTQPLSCNSSPIVCKVGTVILPHGLLLAVFAKDMAQTWDMFHERWLALLYLHCDFY